MPSKILSAALNGLDAVIVSVEADSGGGDFGQITIVGLPDTAVSEAKERVKSALRNCGLTFPRRKITVNLAPADLKKHGPAYDLSIAISILALKNNFKIDINNCLFIGELSLAGEVRSINGLLSMALAAKKANIKTLFVPENNASEAKLIKELTVFPVKNLAQLIYHLKGQKLINPTPITKLKKHSNDYPDLFNIKGQEQAKRALEICAAGGHNLLFFGPPGSGKTMLAKTMPGILPPLNLEEELEITKIHSAAGELKDLSLISSRPFRSPHHSSSSISLIGGGSWPRPGEISLAHNGVLHLDEFPEFSRHAIENLRQPLEDGYININRAAGHLCFPAKFILLATMNPCPCGYFGDKQTNCHCNPGQIHKYRRRLSGPIIDRIDLHIEVPRISWEKLKLENYSESSSEVKYRVNLARQKQIIRFKNTKIFTNSEMNNTQIKEFCHLSEDGYVLLNQANEKMNLSARAYFRILKIARTIADLNEEKQILPGHLAEALQYRPKLYQ